MNNQVLTFLVLGLGLASCTDNSGEGNAPDGGRDSGEEDTSSGGSGGGSGGDPHHDSGGASGTPGSGGMGGMMMMDGSMMVEGGARPHAPMMQSVMPMGGALHVMWTNVTADCDKVELLRNHDGGPYAVAYTLTGAASSQHDTQATGPGTYCYKTRCVKGSETSADSDEKCGTP